ncbi:GDSL esterase/lipase [Capsicum annuum]|nr:GDSL esterase/lipase [Capsicum annuum]KAF3668763.1 GDSL esterase/lipase [Capsicum annuum]
MQENLHYYFRMSKITALGQLCFSSAVVLLASLMMTSTVLSYTDGILVLAFSAISPEAEARAFFVFGDSLVDNGNNNYLVTSARADSPLYGIDYPTHRATGRFSNGLNMPDIISEQLGMEPTLPYLAPELTGKRLLVGANFASAGVGILNDKGIQFVGEDNSEDYEEEECGGGEDWQLEPQRSHSFSEGTNLFLGQTFKDKKTLKLLLKQASVKMSFNYKTLKSSKKYLRVRELSWFHVHKYVGEHTYGIDHVTGKHKNVTVELIASLILNFFVDNKGLSPKEIERIVFRELQAELLEVLDGKHHCAEHSSRVDEESSRFIYYFMAFGAFIRGYEHMRKVFTVDAYTLEEFNHYYNALKERCPSITACLEHEVGFEKWSRAHFPGNRFNIMTSNIVESLNSMLRDERGYPVAAIFNSIAHKFGEIFRKRYAEVDNSKKTFVPVAEMIMRENMIEGDKLYVNNINRSTDEFTVLGYSHSIKVNLLRWSCSCRKYDLVKFPCAHAMAALYLKYGDEYGTSIYNYSLKIYSKESYLLVYLEPICATPLELEWSVS